MISRRLTNSQKAEILEAYTAGENTNSLADKFGCTSSTIHRTVKNLLSKSEYSLLKEERSNISSKKVKIVNNQNIEESKEDLEEIKEDLEHLCPLDVINEKVNNNDLNKELDTDIKKNDYLFKENPDNITEVLTTEKQIQNNQDYDENSLNIDNNFELIEPLLSSFDFDQEKQKSDFKMHDFENLPESVYMIVDKKVELESQLISDLPEWSFLPANELKRNAILLFDNQRSAKRICSRNQRVIKIPNTSIFQLLKSYLISRGITRLILEDSIIALDN